MGLWRELSERGWAAVKRMCADGDEEGQTLEFKSKERSETSELSTSDKKNLGESLSAFSNATGGVILFGLEDKKDEFEIDHAEKPQPLSDATAFASKVKSLIPEILSPPHSDIEVIAILKEGSAQEGVVAIRVGPSHLRPHMSMATTHQKYFVRAGASNRPMVDFQVRDMIRVQRTPRLMLSYQLRQGAVAGAVHHSTLVFTLTNAGSVSARQAYLLVKDGTPLHSRGPVKPHFEDIDVVGSAYKAGVQAISGFSIHPGVGIGVIGFVFEVDKTSTENLIRHNAAVTTFTRYKDLKPLQIKVAVGCEDASLEEVEFVLSREEVEQMAERIVQRETYQSPNSFAGRPPLV